jgi:hypothetical protein
MDLSNLEDIKPDLTDDDNPINVDLNFKKKIIVI